jgi:hypothetical protein
MKVIGAGNTGMVLATEFNDDPILFSTAHQDTVNFKGFDVFSFSNDGASKRFKTGLKIWERNETRLRDILQNIKDDKVIIFSSLGGGSGSSSLYLISKILKDNNNKVLIAGVIPYKKEQNPPLSNFILSINNLMPLIYDISIILFDNEKLRKQFENNWDQINHHIVKVVDYLLNMVKSYSVDKYSPLTLDQSELESVIFGGGFVDFSDMFLEEKYPKFEYGSLDKNTKNCLISMFVDKRKEDEDMNKYHKIFTGVMDKISRRCPNARIIPGILRGSLNKTNASKEDIRDRAYITIASGLSIDKYMSKISKIRDLAVEKAMAYSENEKTERIIDSKASKILDI